MKMYFCIYLWLDYFKFVINVIGVINNMYIVNVLFIWSNIKSPLIFQR
ncbi:Uncharacterised protein [Yersinia pekkanenii]|uniref:Uncharacterized protein n=1 Tax=Yersinia pekkanenii TaxID=1288385 RepID=A0A0T9PY08_9GAMM|nr:Uncharacterised protein [Yersinia pekkanenii]CRY63485.1 Uncharacterised protein [Yersinia pekkanenii]